MAVIATNNEDLIVERTLSVTPLGIRFWDYNLGLPVRGGLRVVALPLKGDAHAVPAVRTPSGVYAFRNLPGLHSWEYPAENRRNTSSPPLNREFVLKVMDTLGRFLEVAGIVEAPQYEDGIFPPTTDASPVGRAPGFSLFSAPTRQVQPGIAVIRGQLWDYDRGGPASYGVVKVDIQGEIQSGIADKRGAFAILCPYPNPKRSQDGSPSVPGPPLHEQAWPIKVRVAYGGADTSPLPRTELPNIKKIWRDQVLATIFASQAANEPVDVLDETLIFGQELILRTYAKHRLHIRSMASPV